MKIVSLLISLLVFGASGYFFVNDFTNSTEINYLIYMTLLVILMLICVIGIMINLPVIIKQRSKVKNLVYNSYSERRVRNNEFDRQFKMFNISQ